MSSTALLDSLASHLSGAARRALTDTVTLARRRGLALYLVGGALRDLLLERPQIDLDIAVEGDAVGLAQAIAEKAGGRVTVHEAFGTASVSGDLFSLDLAQTRSESYPQPGALPLVRPASLDDDLARRDFTVNAMALRLTPPRAGSLIDPFGGREALRRRELRVLHERSFQDDATRMLRAVRYEARLAFHLQENTEYLLRRDRPYFAAISGARIRRELLALLYEDNVDAALSRGQDLALLAAIHPRLAFDEAASAALARAREGRPAPWDEFCLCLLAWRADSLETEKIAERLALSRRHRRALDSAVSLRALTATLKRADAPASALVEAIEALGPAPLWALALREPDTLPGRRAAAYLQEWRHVRPFLTGRALKRMGIPEGPQIGALLRRLRAARLDGLTQTREDETALVEAARRQPPQRRR